MSSNGIRFNVDTILFDNRGNKWEFKRGFLVEVMKVVYRKNKTVCDLYFKDSRNPYGFNICKSVDAGLVELGGNPHVTVEEDEDD